jgi:hypothetical protein
MKREIIPSHYYYGYLMDLETLKIKSKKDLIISNEEKMDQESFHNQKIKQEWLDLKADFELLLIKAKTDHQQMYRQKWEYYGGKADAKVYAAKPFDIKVMKTDLQMYIQSDDDILRLQNKIGYYDSCVDYCKGVIKSIDIVDGTFVTPLIGRSLKLA